MTDWTKVTRTNFNETWQIGFFFNYLHLFANLFSSLSRGGLKLKPSAKYYAKRYLEYFIDRTFLANQNREFFSLDVVVSKRRYQLFLHAIRNVNFLILRLFFRRRFYGIYA